MEINEDEFLTMQRKCEAFDLINYRCQGALDNYASLQVIEATSRFDAQYETANFRPVATEYRPKRQECCRRKVLPGRAKTVSI